MLRLGPDRWTEQGNPGQGFQFVPLPESGKVLASWYTYRAGHQPGSRTDQKWLLGLGDFQGDTVAFTLSASARGAFDSAPTVSPTAQGTLVLRLDSCAAAEASYRLELEGEVLVGTMSLEQITDDGVCRAFRVGGIRNLEQFDAPGDWRLGQSGAWHDPAKPGQGMVLDILPQTGQVIATWCTFDAGQAGVTTDQPHLWLAGVGTLSAPATTIDLFESRGGRLDSDTPSVLEPLGSV